MIKKLEQNIFHFISQNQLFETGDKLLIALSGGPDSVFALHFLNKNKKRLNIELLAIHINHSLRGEESDKDEKFCEQICNALNIHFNSITVDVIGYSKVYKETVEEAARNLRYKKISEYAQIISADKIVTAHNLNDNTETVLFNLFRGTGLKGASGIPPKRDNIIRPFLSTPKDEIVNYLDSNGIEYRIDSSNLSNDFSRNSLRNEIIPILKEKFNPKLDESIFRFSEIARNAEAGLRDYIQEKSEKYFQKDESGIVISNQIAVKENKNFGKQFLKTGLEKHFSKSFTFSDISKLVSLFSLQVGTRIELTNRISAVKDREFISVFCIDDEVIKQTFELHLNDNVKIGETTICSASIDLNEKKFSTYSTLEYIDGDNLTFPLLIRRWKNGDKFQPLGITGRKSVADFLTDVKVKAKDKKNKLVLLNNSKIIWVVGERIDESVKIKDETKRIVKLWVK